VISVIWLGMIVISIMVGAATGRLDAVNRAVFEGAKTGVSIAIGLIGILAFWLGMMKIAEQAGILRALSRLLAPLVRRLFPDVPPNHPAMGYILSNMTANLFGLGNAATPMGIKAMEELQKLNPDPKTATPAMCTLLALNTASLTLIPTTVIALRAQMGSGNPVEIVGTTLVATAIGTATAIVFDRWFRRRSGGR
jgi:Uncharacterized membrane protein, required for spore maturation in B.subtilis.